MVRIEGSEVVILVASRELERFLEEGVIPSNGDRDARTNEASPQTHEVYRQKMSRGKWG
jgi:hypothetical protein